MVLALGTLVLLCKIEITVFLTKCLFSVMPRDEKGLKIPEQILGSPSLVLVQPTMRNAALHWVLAHKYLS